MYIWGTKYNPNITQYVDPNILKIVKLFQNCFKLMKAWSDGVSFVTKNYDEINEMD